MRKIENAIKLQEYLKWCSEHNKSVGFVPTMGALHEGHLSLVNKADSENDIVIVSIFVNPTQFNNPKDLEKYPRNVDADAQVLSKTGCNVIFAPTVEDIYPADFTARKVDLGKLDDTLEGLHRPGHFDGVVQVVQRLFDLVQPTRAYFGRKDFQQVAVIKTMVKELAYDLEICVGDTVREESGLAMSSRNLLLSDTEKIDAIDLSAALTKMKKMAETMGPGECAMRGRALLNKSNLRLEYLDIIDPLTFDVLEGWVPGATVCVVAYCGEVRLIDNMELIAEV